MKSKIIKRPQEESESIPVLKKENVKLKKEVSSLKKEKVKAERKIQAQETTILTVRNQKAQAVHRFVVLQAKYDALQMEQSKSKEITPLVLSPVVMKILQELGESRKYPIHDEPPKKENE